MAFRKIVIFLGVLMFSLNLHANSANSGFGGKSALPKHFSQMLENGMQVVAIPLENGSGVVSTDIFYKVGSRNEKLGKSGIAHMLEHLNFKSSENLKAGEFDKIVKSFGGATNAGTSFDYTHYYIRSSAQNMGKSMELFSELLGGLKLLDSEFQPERKVVLEERYWRTDNSPMGYLYFRLFNTAFVYHPYHWTPIGFIEDIKGWEISDIREFWETYYQPKNAVLVVAGDIEPNAVFTEAKRTFGKLQNKRENIPQVENKEPEQDGLRTAFVRKESEVDVLALAYKIPPFNSEDSIAISALSEILSGGKSSRLVRELVDKKRVASEIYAYDMSLIDEGLFLFMGMANSGVSLEKLQSEILAQIEAIKSGKISQDELDKVKANMRLSFLKSLESSASTANLFGSYLVRGDLNSLLDFESRFEKLALADIVNVANKIFNMDKATIISLKK